MFVFSSVSRYRSYLNTAVTLLNEYNGSQPFPVFSKAFFNKNKKYGSTDRKQISHLCYCYFRLGKALPALPVEERILTGLLLCSDQPVKLLEALWPEMNAFAGIAPEEKHAKLGIGYPLLDVFPWVNELSADIESGTFNQSFFVQPDLYLRLRPGKEKSVQAKLHNAGIAFTIAGPRCVTLSNASGIDTVIDLNKDAVVQDYNSQQIGDSLLPVIDSVQPMARQRPLSVWDCCAASGGKSIMARDIMGDIDLTVSDIRPSILANLKRRFIEAGLTNYKAVVADVTALHPGFRPPDFDLIMADVPCTGSGTWGRTPEQLFYFEQGKIASYAALQQKIVSHTIPFLKPGGFFLYSTCSVFKEENEWMADLIQARGLHPVHKRLLKGYDKKADTLFVALFQKPG